MALTASTLITTAKNRSFGSTGRQKLSVPMLLAELSYQDQKVMQMLSQIAPDLLATVSGVISITSSGNANGYTLAGGMHYRNFTHVDPTTNDYTPINMVQRIHQESRVASPAGMVTTVSAAGVFYPIDPLNKRWQGSDTRLWYDAGPLHTVSYSYIPIPATVTALSSTLNSPDMAREVFTTALEVRVLLAGPPATPEGREEWQVRVQAALAAYTEAVTSLQWQAYKFVNPQGQPGGKSTNQSESSWVDDQVVG